MKETEIVEALVMLGRDVDSIARRLGAAVYDDDSVHPSRHEVVQADGWTIIYVSPQAPNDTVAQAVIAHAARLWGANVGDLERAGRVLLRRL